MEKTNTPKVTFRKVLKHLWIALKPQKWLFFFGTLSFFMASLITIFVPLFYKDFFDLLASEAPKEILVPQLLRIIYAILITYMIMWAFTRFGIFTANRILSKTISRIRQNSFDYTIRHSYSFFSNNFTGSLVERVQKFARSFDRLYDLLLFNAIPLTIQVLGAIIVVYLQQPVISYIIIGWIALIFIFTFFFQRWKLKYDLVATKASSKTTGVLADAISNQNTILSFSQFENESKKFKEVTDDQANKFIFTWDLGATKDAFQGFLIVVVEFLIFYYAIQFWQKGALTIGTFILIQTYIISLSHRLWDFGRIIRNLYESFADSKEMVEILETEYEVKDLPKAKKIKVAEGKIEFKDISFAFNESQDVLKNLNIEIKSGEKTALIGPSGAGKSTIVKLLLRMYDPSSGRIEIDKQDIKKVSQDSLRKNISLVPQDPILFHRSLMENIRYGREDATDKEVIEASKLAHCDEFIESLPLKYETFVGERGVKLSGGERQRVAIARAILKNAPILILDEATSSLDSHSEYLIQDALDKLMKGKTSIVIAHRLSTIRKMDRIIVLENGKIIEDGPHDDLLSKEVGLYKKLWNLQAGGFLVE